MFGPMVLEENQEEMVEAMGHVPVMPMEVLEYLNPKAGKTFVDCTLGLGGHAKEILSHIGSSGRFVGIERDTESLAIAKDNLLNFAAQCLFASGDFRNIDQLLQDLGVQEVDGFLFDLGISSFQLDNPKRGFSLQKEGPLDMRMDQTLPISAYDLINSLSEKELINILNNFGQERWAQRISRKLISERQRNPITSTHQLRDLVLRAIPYQSQREKIHPATRTFQAFRIAVNCELESLSLAMDRCMPFLKKGGRIVVISFHSLEDKIVKEKFRSFTKLGNIHILLKKPLRPGPEEILRNPRSRSARLRAAERI